MKDEARRDLAVPLAVQLRLADDRLRREWAVNLSAGGLCLHARDPLPEGQRLRVSFEIEDIQLAEVPSRVAWQCQGPPDHRFYEIGLHFEELALETETALRAWASQPTQRRR